MGKEAYIYVILNKINKKFYIGSTVDFERRKSEHIGQLNKGVHINRRLQEDWIKFGEENFVFSIRKVVTEEMKDKEEEILISNYLGQDCCYNENPNNDRVVKRRKVYLYDLTTKEQVYEFNSYTELSEQTRYSTGKLSDYVWEQQVIEYDNNYYLIGLTPNKFIPVDQQILNCGCNINIYSIKTGDFIKSITPLEYLTEIEPKYKRVVFTHTNINGYTYYFESEEQPKEANLLHRNKQVYQYDKFGRFIQVFDTQTLQKEVGKQNWERIRSVSKKNIKALNSDNKQNFNKTYDGYIYIIGCDLPQQIGVHLVRIEKEKTNEIYYFCDKKECGTFLGITNSAVVYAIKNNGRCLDYKVQEVIATECDLSELPTN